jgi:homoserine kinase
MSVTRATAFAPGSVANVAIGFDILGFSVDAVGDRVTATRSITPGVRVLAIRGTKDDLPLEAERNTAGRAVMAMVEGLSLDFGIELEIDKGIPLASGLGGSAASAVAAVVAVNALLPVPLPRIELLGYAMQGEAVASGSRHADNISPSLFGGLVLTVGIDHPRVKQIPVPKGVSAVIAHPHLYVSTKQARAILSRTVNMSDFVWQTAHLAGFISACYTDDIELIRETLQDVVIERQRQELIPGFMDVRNAAMAQGALGCSISGAGPTMFALTLDADAQRVRDAMIAQFTANNLEVDHWVVPMSSAGARVVGV